MTAMSRGEFGYLKAIGYANGRIEIENGATTPLYWHTMPVLDLDFSVFQGVPILGSVSADKTVAFWQPKLGKWKVMKKDLEFNVEVTAISFEPGCNRVAVGFEDGTVQVRMVGSDFEVTREFRLDCGPVKLGYMHGSSDSLVCVDGNGAAVVYRNGQRAEAIGAPRKAVRDLAISSDDKIALIYEDSSVVVVSGGHVEEIDAEMGETKPMLCFWEDVTDALVLTMENGHVAPMVRAGNNKWMKV